MIAYLKGEITHAEPSLLWVECSGVGYALRVSLNTYSKLKNLKTAQIYTYLQVRDDGLVLYGFSNIKERQWFEMLTSVSGVGGSTALAILSKLTTDDLNKIIHNSDIPTLKSIKGIGEKTAGRILLELKGKVASLPEPISDSGNDRLVSEAVAALVTLGYDKKEAEKNVLNRLREYPDSSLEGLIRNVLRA